MIIDDSFRDMMDDDPLDDEDGTDDASTWDEAQEQEYYKEIRDDVDDGIDAPEMNGDDYLETEYAEGSPQHILAQSIEGQALIDEWGDNFREKLDQAIIVKEYAQTVAPDFLKQLDGELYREDGTPVDIMNNPDFLRLAATFGKMQLAGGDEGPRNIPASLSPNDAAPNTTTTVSNRLDELYNLVGTEEYKSKAVQREIKALEKARGDRPAVGSGGRYA